MRKRTRTCTNIVSHFFRTMIFAQMIVICPLLVYQNIKIKLFGVRINILPSIYFHNSLIKTISYIENYYKLCQSCKLQKIYIQSINVDLQLFHKLVIFKYSKKSFFKYYQFIISSKIQNLNALVMLLNFWSLDIL